MCVLCVHWSQKRSFFIGNYPVFHQALPGLNSDQAQVHNLGVVQASKDQLRLYKRILKDGLSVRAVERLARELSDAEKKEPAKEDTPAPDMYSGFADMLSQRFSTPVKFTRNSAGRGSITIKFSSDDELHRLIKALE